MKSGADELRDWIDRRGFSQVEAAKYIGLTTSFLSLLLNGKRGPGLSVAYALLIQERTGIPVQTWASSIEVSVGDR